MKTYKIEYSDGADVINAETFEILDNHLIFYSAIKEAGQKIPKRTVVAAVAPGWRKVWIVE